MKKPLFTRQIALKSLAVSALLLLPSLSTAEPLLSVKEIMNAIITPSTGVIWGAYQLETDAQWSEVENAALAVIAAGDLMRSGGAGEGEIDMAAQEQWQTFTSQMILASRDVLAAVADKDEEALFNAGNDGLYPPCESCHQVYQTR